MMKLSKFKFFMCPKKNILFIVHTLQHRSLSQWCHNNGKHVCLIFKTWVSSLCRTSSCFTKHDDKRENNSSKMFCRQHLRKAYLGHTREESFSKVFCKQHLRKAYLGHVKGERFLKNALETTFEKGLFGSHERRKVFQKCFANNIWERPTWATWREESFSKMFCNVSERPTWAMWKLQWCDMIIKENTWQNLVEGMESTQQTLMEGI